TAGLNRVRRDGAVNKVRNVRKFALVHPHKHRGVSRWKGRAGNWHQNAVILIDGITGDGVIARVRPSSCGTLAPGASCTTSVTFTPSRDGAAFGLPTFRSGANDFDDFLSGGFALYRQTLTFIA
ncbi:MAG: hypothetical protein ACREQX_08885, partial [Candidatus Binataceae bacterium]